MLFAVDAWRCLQSIIRMSPLIRLFSHGVAALAAVVLGSSNLCAEVKLPTLFTDHMVLQQGASVPVWGWADEGEKVTVQFRGQTVQATSRGGKWIVKLRNLKAGGPDTLTVSGSNRIVITDVLVGEVWAASGQSNMEWQLKRTFEPKEAIDRSANSSLRLFTVPKTKLNSPTNNINSKWVECGPATVADFSAVAYYFGRDLQKALGVPVGMIHTSWGGSPAEAWMSEPALEGNPRYKTEVLDGYATAMNNHKSALAKWLSEEAALAKEGKKPAGNKPNPPFWRPGELYNGMIAPVIPYAIKGAIWYQGESNAGRAEQYRSLMADMISNWRQDWGSGDFTFLQVQLAPWDRNKKRSIEEITREPGDSDWAELREAQWLVSRKFPKAGMAVITDVGEKDEIHPTKKEPVGARLALQARKIAYGQKLTAGGPIYRSMSVRGDKATLRFENVGSGLQAVGGALKGFSIAGEDRKFVWAQAVIEGGKVIVSSPSVAKPVAVRYGWADYPVVNLSNMEGLPASPFRTDDFPMITKGKK